MSYVITIRRPPGAPPLTRRDFQQVVDSDESLSNMDGGGLVWTSPDSRREFYITQESDHLWTDGVRGEEADNFLYKLSEIAGRLDARVYGEEGEDLTDPGTSPVMGAGEKLGMIIGVLLLMLSIPFLLIIFMIRLPVYAWRIWRAVR